MELAHDRMLADVQAENSMLRSLHAAKATLDSKDRSARESRVAEEIAAFQESNARFHRDRQIFSTGEQFVIGAPPGGCGHPRCRQERPVSSDATGALIRFNFCTAEHHRVCEAQLFQELHRGGPGLNEAAARVYYADGASEEHQCALPGCGLPPYRTSSTTHLDYCCRGHAPGGAASLALVASSRPLDLVTAYPSWAATNGVSCTGFAVAGPADYSSVPVGGSRQLSMSSTSYDRSTSSTSVLDKAKLHDDSKNVGLDRHGQGAARHGGGSHYPYAEGPRDVRGKSGAKTFSTGPFGQQPSRQQGVPMSARAAAHGPQSLLAQHADDPTGESKTRGHGSGRAPNVTGGRASSARDQYGYPLDDSDFQHAGFSAEDTADHSRFAVARRLLKQVSVQSVLWADAGEAFGFDADSVATWLAGLNDNPHAETNDRLNRCRVASEVCSVGRGITETFNVRLGASSVTLAEKRDALETGHRVFNCVMRAFILSSLRFKLPLGVGGVHISIAVDMSGRIVPILAFARAISADKFRRTYGTVYSYVKPPTSTALRMVSNMVDGHDAAIVLAQAEARQQFERAAADAARISSSIMAGSGSATASGHHTALMSVETVMNFKMMRAIISAVTFQTYPLSNIEMGQCREPRHVDETVFATLSRVNHADIAVPARRSQHIKNAAEVDEASNLLACSGPISKDGVDDPASIGLMHEFAQQYLREYLGSPLNLFSFFLKMLRRHCKTDLPHLTVEAQNTYVDAFIMSVNRKTPILASAELYALAAGLNGNADAAYLRLEHLKHHLRVVARVLGSQSPIIRATSAHINEMIPFADDHGDMLVGQSIAHTAGLVDCIMRARARADFSDVDFNTGTQLSTTTVYRQLLMLERRLAILERRDANGAAGAWPRPGAAAGLQNKVGICGGCGFSMNDARHHSRCGSYPLPKPQKFSYKPNKNGVVYSLLPMNHHDCSPCKKEFYAARAASGIPWNICWSMVSRWVTKADATPTACSSSHESYCKDSGNELCARLTHTFAGISKQHLRVFRADAAVVTFCENIVKNPIEGFMVFQSDGKSHSKKPSQPSKTQ